MNTDRVRTRMAPSPTGEYHIGHIRTVLYNIALAKKNYGQFILRIEDTDRGRYVEGAVDRILSVISDYGLSWDEGPVVGGPYEPYFQSQRLDIYKKYAQELVKNDHAYYCFCSQERLNDVRKKQQEQKLPTTKYDRYCRDLSKEEVDKRLANGDHYVIRQKVPDNRTIKFHDEVLGDISINSNDIEDGVLLKSDGFPTYHLAVVIDDHLMKITHVMRGCDWIPSTPKHVLLYQAFDWELPKYIHLPNLKEIGGNKKLSKRFGSTEAREFLEEGYLPEAVLNFLMLVGWNPGTEKEIYSLQEFINDFSLGSIHKTDLVAFDREKLLWYNGYYVRSLAPEELFKRLLAWSVKYEKDLGVGDYPHDYVIKVLGLIQERLKTFSEFSQLTGYFFGKFIQDKSIISKFTESNQKAQTILGDFYSILSTVDWQKDVLDSECYKLIAEKGYKTKEAFMTLRLAIAGVEATPHIFDVIEVLGKEETLKRVKFYLN